MQLVATTQEIVQIAKILEQESEIAFDTEFIRETTFFPQLEILQVAGAGQVWLIDAQALNTEQIKPLLNVFLNPKILKVVHAAHGDQECLWAAYGVLAAPVFDTAVGASLMGLGDNIGLGKLLKLTVGVELAKGYARTNWAKRPLPPAVLEYAALDVQYLIEVKNFLFKKLEEQKRTAWAMELSAKFSDIKLYDVPAEDMTKKLAQNGKFNLRDYGVLMELVKWRESRVRELNVPRRWLADDGVLMDLAKIKPKTEEQIKSFRGLSKGEHRSPHLERLLKVIQVGLSEGVEAPADLKRRTESQPTSEESRGLDLLRVYLSMLSDETGVALKHLVQPNDMLPLLRLKPETVEAISKSGFVSPQVGAEGVQKLFEFLTGARVLKMQGSGAGSICT